jgi:CRP/FNR family transcriptional regulator
MCGVLDDDELVELDRLARSVSVAPRHYLMHQDEPATSLYNVTAGVVRLYRLLEDGRRQVIGFALPGDFLGLSMREHHNFCADALTPVVACQFPRTAFSHFIDERPALLRRLYDMAGHELTLAQEQMVVLGQRTALEKVAAFLNGLRKRWQAIYGTSPTLPLPMTRQDIADYLGLTIETVSRMMTRLAREKIIVIVPDGIRLLDLPRLEDLAQT